MVVGKWEGVMKLLTALLSILVFAGVLQTIGAQTQPATSAEQQQERLTKELIEVRKNYPLAYSAYAANQYQLIQIEMSVEDMAAFRCQRPETLLFIPSVLDSVCSRVICMVNNCPKLDSCTKPDRQGEWPDPSDVGPCIRAAMSCRNQSCGQR
jgi:hypothetical protein